MSSSNAVISDNATPDLLNLSENNGSYIDSVTDYIITDFTDEGIKKLSDGVRHTLTSSSETITPAGGLIYEFFKRFFDIALSAFALLVLSLPLLVVTLLIYLEDKGNPFFSQIRFTKDGKPFKMYKFRSMCIDAEDKFKEVQAMNETGGIAFKMEDDPRITKIGKFIRKTSIDELPQLINVILGDMSIIGPRPPLPREVVYYTPREMNRLLVKGGLSCYCQCSGRSDMSVQEWFESDLKYICERSLWVDFMIIVKTVKAVLCKDGAK